MQRDEMERYRERLRAERDRLQADVESSSASRVEKLQPPGELSHLPTHNADHDVEGLDQQVAVESTQRNELQAVIEALGRIDDGTFGTCQRCGQQILEERLDALPFTPYCIQCERLEEEGR